MLNNNNGATPIIINVSFIDTNDITFHSFIGFSCNIFIKKPTDCGRVGPTAIKIQPQNYQTLIKGFIKNLN